MKKILLALGTTVVIATPIASVVSCGTSSSASKDDKIKAEKIKEILKQEIPKETKDKEIEKINEQVSTVDYDISKMNYFDQETFNANADYSNKNKFIDYEPKNENIMDTAKSADINLYYTPAVAPFSNLLRLSMLTPSENHLYTIEEDGWEVFEAKVNKEKLQDYYVNASPSAGASKVLGIAGTDKNDRAGKALSDMQKIIQQNPDKKINIWWNSIDTDQMGKDNLSVYNLGGYKNVNIQLIEDGSSMGTIQTEAFERAKNNWKPSSSGNDQVFISSLFVPGKIKSWVSDEHSLELNKINKNNRKYDLFNMFKYETLSDSIFNTRDSNNQRLSSIWPEISGLDWKDAADIVENANKIREKPSLLVLGSYKVAGESAYVESLCAKYGEEYNIFYKGHPGHMAHTLTLTNWKNKKNDDDLEKIEHKNSFYVLDPMINSEQLTREHVIPKTGKVEGVKYIQFDKVIAVKHTSAVNRANFPNLDIEKDVIEIYNGPDDIRINPSVNPSSKNWAPEAAWLKELKQN